MNKKLLSRGAEAEIYLIEDPKTKQKKILKSRIKKSYRTDKIDNSLRKFRTNRESKILEKLKNKINCPKLINLDEKKNKTDLELEFIEGKKLKEILDDEINDLKKTTKKTKKKQTKNKINETLKNILKEIGRDLAKIHNLGIIHGDLTTSNMIFNEKENKLYFIDFGLSFFSEKIEDKAVDLHLLKRALESKHSEIYEQAFKIILEEYKKNVKNSKEIIKRFNNVELRGRNKAKI